MFLGRLRHRLEESDAKKGFPQKHEAKVAPSLVFGNPRAVDLGSMWIDGSVLAPKRQNRKNRRPYCPKNRFVKNRFVGKRYSTTTTTMMMMMMMMMQDGS